MIGDFGSKPPPNQDASGLVLKPPFGIGPSQAKPEQVAVSTASACSTNQKIVNSLLIQPPAYMTRHHTKLQAVGDFFVASGTSSTPRGVPFSTAAMSIHATTAPLTQQQKTVIIKPSSVQIPLLNGQ